MTTITALPTPPSRADSTTFSTRGDAFLGALPTFVTEANAVGSEASAAAAAAAASASSAAAQAAIAAAQAATAVNAVGATVWASGTYAQYAVAISPTDGLTYRKIGASGTSSTDPKLDAVNWVCLNVSSNAASSIFFQQNFGGF